MLTVKLIEKLQSATLKSVLIGAFLEAQQTAEEGLRVKRSSESITVDTAIRDDGRVPRRRNPDDHSNPRASITLANHVGRVLRKDSGLAGRHEG